MNPSLQIPRRTFLRGLGAAMALPLLDAMAPLRALGAAAAKPPLRMGFFFIPNGAHMPDWTPAAEGSVFDLPYILNPLEAHRSELLVISGLSQDKGRPNGDGGGDHARSAASWLTGAQPLKNEGSQIRAGVSADQIAAPVLGKNTRFLSLELGLEPGRQGGKCDSGYSCAYSNNISWRNESTPMTREINPRLVFERLFANEVSAEVGESQARRARYQQSILDFVREDARALTGRLGYHDRQKIDEYLNAVREIERRVEYAERSVSEAAGNRVAAGYEIPEGIPESYSQHATLMCDMLVLAFQGDVTRVSTFMLANEASNRSYRALGIADGHHSLSHHQGDPLKQAQIREINRFHVGQFGYLLSRLKSIPEGEGTLLDHCLLLYGSGLADGNNHEHQNLPLMLAGRGGGAVLPGRHRRYPDGTPMANLLLSMLKIAGAAVPRLGDSTGTLPGLDG